MLVQFGGYLRGNGCFATRTAYTEAEPADFWQDQTETAPQLARLALHLFSISVHSAAGDRLFSVAREIHAPHRMTAQMV